ncbi:hypothetical protein [Acinetobacter shaoyimingii]|uniref:Uncharacterized protein n=1 Tax=Acinetobacter shaoyimingii TaxID=2715164 RepID=A0A6G8RX57_9GAMM|nr:hypothetical protein [Acinetobacter shaoyimingii]QIO06526.1 hypothetical protein G8E00_11470 [Acinetobacter shaoyimingii]
MKEEVKIAIFGLSLNVLENIKQKITSIYADSVELKWANIADPQLDILLVNDMFFGSPTIQSLVNGNRVPYLRLVNDSNKLGKIENDVLYLPLTLSDTIQDWFKQSYKNVPTLQASASTKTEQHKPVNVDYEKVLDEFLSGRNGNVQVFDSKGNIAIVNTNTEQVWMNAERRIAGTDQTINFTYATMQTMQSVTSQQGKDLRTWLWNLLWYSPVLDQDISSDVYFKLNVWPQPEMVQDRQNIFKIAACFERGASIKQVQKKLSLDKDIIERFVSVSLLCKAIVEIQEQDAKLKIADQRPEGSLRGFFGSLRSKLGL